MERLTIAAYFMLLCNFYTGFAADIADTKNYIGCHRTSDKPTIRVSTHGVVIETNNGIKDGKHIVIKKISDADMATSVECSNVYPAKFVIEFELYENSKQPESKIVRFDKKYFDHLDEPSKYVISSELESLLTKEDYEKFKGENSEQMELIKEWHEDKFGKSKL